MQTRWAKSLGELEATHQEIWGTSDYISRYEPTCFFGMYDLRDYIALWRHKGGAWILWTGSDVRNLKNGFLFNDGKLKKISKILRGNWWVFPILYKAEHWVENKTEYTALKELGIESQICPSFLGDIDKFEISYKPSKKPKVYTSVSGDKFGLYGWDKIPRLARENPDIEFHLYGSTFPFAFDIPNVFIHGRVPKEQMNNEIKKMQGALRLTEFDGFSEILAKSILWGQWPISPFIDYPHILKDISGLRNKKKPNIEGRNYYRKNLNAYPWVKKH